MATQRGYLRGCATQGADHAKSKPKMEHCQFQKWEHRPPAASQVQAMYPIRTLALPCAPPRAAVAPPDPPMSKRPLSSYHVAARQPISHIGPRKWEQNMAAPESRAGAPLTEISLASGSWNADL